MRKVAVFTATRAEYGLLRGLIARLRADQAFELQLIVAGMHLSPEFGRTIGEIEADGLMPDARVEMLLSSDTAVGVAKSMGLGCIGFADALDRLRPDVLLVLGDRFEALAVAQVALVMGIPIAHLHGGEVTSGAYDDSIRHAITKMASVHFVAAPDYRRRVIQLGEHPDRVHVVGALGLDALHEGPGPDFTLVAAELGLDPLGSPALATYHPVTASSEDTIATCSAMLDALLAAEGLQTVITYPNADNGGRALIDLLNRYGAAHPHRLFIVPSLGMRRYKAVLRQAAFVIGNSSSGIIEAPSAGIPSVNVGERQAGRLSADSVIHCGTTSFEIASAINLALDPSFRAKARTVVNPYGAGHSAQGIVGILRDCPLPLGKTFFDQGASNA